MHSGRGGAPIPRESRELQARPFSRLVGAEALARAPKGSFSRPPAETLRSPLASPITQSAPWRSTAKSTYVQAVALAGASTTSTNR